MADYDRRDRGYRGGGGYNNRKRRYRNDDDEDRFDDRRQRRRRDDAPLPVRVRRQLLSIAESPLRNWADEVQSIAYMVADNYDEDENLREMFVQLSLQLVTEQPLKTPFVAAVVLVANTRKPEVVELVLKKVAEATEKAVADGEWRQVKLLLKFIACLSNCLEGDGIFPLLEELFNRAADLQTASSDDTIGTEIVKAILLTIPYVMSASPDRFKQQAADLMEKTEIIASEPHALQALVDPFVPKGEDKSSTGENICMLLQKQLQGEANNGWKLSCLPRPWDMPLSDIEAQDKLTNATKHALPAVTIPSTVVAGSNPLFPEMYFSVYADQEVDSVPPPTSIASSLIRDGLGDSINILNFNRNVTARILMDLDCYFAEGTFLKRATPFDELRNQPEGRTTWKPEDVAVDTVFSELFRLPKPENKLIYYHSVLTEACKLGPAAVAPSLGRAIRYLYRNSPHMDLELSYRFLDWFSHHLSNFGFTWKWAEWSEDTGLPDTDPLVWFLKGSLDKEVRLSFAQRIQKTLPEAYQHLVGPEKEQDVPEFKYKDDNTPFAKEGQELATLLRRKATDEEIQPTIDAIQSLATEQALDPIVSSTDVFMTTICYVGSKSLSHVLACIDRSKTRLLDAGSQSPAARAQILTAVMTYWGAHPGVALSIVEKLLNYSILTPLSVVEWAVNGGDGTSLAQPEVFELVGNTVRKVTGRTRQVLKEEGDAEVRTKEGEAMKQLFKALNDALQGWASGSKDELIEEGDGTSGEEKRIRIWGKRWLRVFQRMEAIEIAYVMEAEKERAGKMDTEA